MTDLESRPASIDFISLGEAVVDLISTGIVSNLEEANSFQRFPGGEVANLAMNMARLGHRAALAVCVGEDGFGQFLLKKFREAGVIMDLIQTTSNAPTTLVPVTRHTKSPDFIIYRGADKYLRLTPQLEHAIQRSGIVHTSAFSLSHDPARNTITTCLQLAHDENILISFDPNYHPKLWPDRPNFISYLQEIYPLVTVTKPSLDDSARIFGPGFTPEEYIERFLAFGVPIVALTMGRDGVYLGTSDGERYRLQAQPLSVVDVTGAGDAFWAGLLAGLSQGLPPLESARLGQSVAEYKINTIGPVESFPPLEDLQKSAQNVKFSSLN